MSKSYGVWRFRRNRRAIRRRLFYEQEGKCYFCRVDCWEPSIESPESAASRLGFPEEAVAHGGSAGRKWRATVARVMATIDHLKSKKHGGGDDEGNLVMACQRCNVAKKDMPVSLFLSKIAKTKSNDDAV